MRPFQIPAECHSDDLVHEIRFDALAWFEQASDEEILGLAACGWGGDYPADAVAYFFADTDPGVGLLFDYLHRVRDRPGAPGFECRVEPRAAARWVRSRRPHLLGRGIDPTGGREHA